MAKTERIEGAREKGHFITFGKLHSSNLCLILTDISVDVVQYSCIIVEVQFTLLFFIKKRHQFLIAVSENLCLFIQRQTAAS